MFTPELNEGGSPDAEGQGHETEEERDSGTRQSADNQAGGGILPDAGLHYHGAELAVQSILFRGHIGERIG